MPLYVVATPLGNLGDLTPRAVEVLRAAETWAAEDTRAARRLAAAAGISLAGKRLLSCGEHNERAVVPKLAAELRAGAAVALFSEGGTPLISDPGFRLVSAALDAGVPVTPVPGPCAAITALCVSGLPTHAFAVYGFPPRRKGKRAKLLTELKERRETLIFYESPKRLARLVGECAEVFGAARPACAARETTKRHEEFIRGSLGELADNLAARPRRGECTLLIAGATNDSEKKSNRC